MRGCTPPPSGETALARHHRHRCQHAGWPRYLLGGLDIVPLTEPVIALAETIGPPHLCSLDAIHLAAAAQIGHALTAFVTYDQRLSDGCRELGLATASPGAIH